MQVTFNPSLNSTRNYEFKNRKDLTFTSLAQSTTNVVKNEAGEVLNKGVKKFINERYEKMTDKIAKSFTAPIVGSKILMGLADKFKNSKNLFQHCLTTGSFITSSVYAYRTVSNENLDKDRRHTLAVNQGLTFLLSTIMNYSLDKALEGWWENVTAKYAGKMINDDKFYDNFVNKNNRIKADNKIAKSKGQKNEIKSLDTVSGALKSNDLYKLLPEKGTKELSKELIKKRLSGMNILKKTLIFGFIYRYFVPVLVTKPTNALCEKYIENKQKKKAQASEAI
jgi:hypothetical protein